MSSNAAERKMLSNYEATLAKGEEAAAKKILLDYSEQVLGENADITVKLIHRYGLALSNEGKNRQATYVLIEALKRSTAVYGKSGGEAFEINMNIGYAYSNWNPDMDFRMKYFKSALEILRDRGEHESMVYVSTLISIVVNLMKNDGLTDRLPTRLGDLDQTIDTDAHADGYVIPMESDYSNYFYLAEAYLEEATELGKKLEIEDEYILSKIAIAQAKLKVMETEDFRSVQQGVGGYISSDIASENYKQEEDRLMISIEKLSEDPELNRPYLVAAKRVLMDIVMKDKDEEHMKAMCASGVLDSQDNYPPDRLYEIMEGGKVFAPEIGIRVSTNIFRSSAARNTRQKDKNGNPIKKPYFMPVCIDGQLMAVLMHAPKVTIEELN
ncbi:MAG: hypothetical protein GY732_02505 [Gammaproteobacteria bacterium]|nr:hypothetical protein [Gammaproteobacteria bacterium]